MPFRYSKYAAFRTEYSTLLSMTSYQRALYKAEQAKAARCNDIRLFELPDWPRSETLNLPDAPRTMSADPLAFVHSEELHGYHIETYDSSYLHGGKRQRLLRPTEVDALERVRDLARDLYKHQKRQQHGETAEAIIQVELLDVAREAMNAHRRQRLERRAMLDVHDERRQAVIEKIPLRDIMAKRGTTMAHLNLGNGILEWTEVVLRAAGD